MAYAEIEERQLGEDRYRVMIYREDWRSLWGSYLTYDQAISGLKEAGDALRKEDQPKTLRDEFAMAALTGLAAANFTDLQPGERSGVIATIGHVAYAIADAMMEARAK